MLHSTSVTLCHGPTPDKERKKERKMGASQKKRFWEPQELEDQCITSNNTPKANIQLGLGFYLFRKGWMNDAGERKIDGKAGLTMRIGQE